MHISKTLIVFFLKLKKILAIKSKNMYIWFVTGLFYGDFFSHLKSENTFIRFYLCVQQHCSGVTCSESKQEKKCNRILFSLNFIKNKTTEHRFILLFLLCKAFSQILW